MKRHKNISPILISVVIMLADFKTGTYRYMLLREKKYMHIYMYILNIYTPEQIKVPPQLFGIKPFQGLIFFLRFLTCTLLPNIWVLIPTKQLSINSKKVTVSNCKTKFEKSVGYGHFF